MDWFDLFPLSGPEDLGRRKLTLREGTAYAVALVVLPLVDLALAMWLAPDGHVEAVIQWIPLALTATAALTCRGLGVSVWRSIALGLGCGFWCFLFSAAIVLMHTMFLPW